MVVVKVVKGLNKVFNALCKRLKKTTKKALASIEEVIKEAKTKGSDIESKPSTEECEQDLPLPANPKTIITQQYQKVNKNGEKTDFHEITTQKLFLKTRSAREWLWG